MNYYSTNNPHYTSSLSEAVTQGLAPDGGLYMPERIPSIPMAFFKHIGQMSLQEIAFVVASTLFGDDIQSDNLKKIVTETLSFDIPLKEVEPGIYALELFHGPTLAFKDVGARFMARMLALFNNKGGDNENVVNVLVATSGDTGSAVANGFLDVPGVRVFVLYPQGKVSRIQEAQFTTLGRNITAIEVDGTFDDCQAMVKSAFIDPSLNSTLTLTSANSINVARFLPQMFYYFHAYARLAEMGVPVDRLTVSVPSGNFGNICSALIAKRMGLNISHFIAANNRNDVFLQYLLTGKYVPRPSVQTVANAMDVGNPSNFARILDLYGGSYDDICRDISGFTYNDDQILHTVSELYNRTGYVLDPHGAVAYRALKDGIEPGAIGIFLETAHPAKFKSAVDSAIGTDLPIPSKLAMFMRGEKQTVKMSPQYPALRKFLLNECH